MSFILDRRDPICLQLDLPNTQSRLPSKRLNHDLITRRQSIRRRLIKQILADKQTMRTVSIRFVNSIQIDIVRHIEIEAHKNEFVVVAERNRLALPGAVVGKDLEEGGVLCAALESKSR